MSNLAKKSVALNVAAAMWIFGLQQLSVGNHLEGAIAVGIGIVVFVGYQYIEDSDHRKEYDRLVEAIGEDTLKELSEVSSDRIREVLNNVDLPRTDDN